MSTQAIPATSKFLGYLSDSLLVITAAEAVAIDVLPVDADSRQRRQIDAGLSGASGMEEEECCPGGVCDDGRCCPPGTSCCQPETAKELQDTGGAGLAVQHMLGSTGMALVAVLFFFLGSVFGPQMQLMLARLAGSS